jgi:hypothetical protein
MSDPMPVYSRSPSRASDEVEACQGDIEMGSELPENPFDDSNDEGCHNTDGSRSPSSHPNQDPPHVASDDHAHDAVPPRVTKK